MSALQAFDPKTGEIHDVEVSRRRGRRHQFPGGFGFVGLVYISKLADQALPAQGYRLALRIMEFTEYGGVCLKRSAELARMIGTSPARTSKLLKMLEDAAIITRLHNRTIIVNPTYYFRGNAEEQAHAIETWSKARGMRLVKPRLATAA